MNETSTPPSSFRGGFPSNGAREKAKTGTTPRPLHLTLGTVTGGSSTPKSSSSSPAGPSQTTTAITAPSPGGEGSNVTGTADGTGSSRVVESGSPSSTLSTPLSPSVTSLILTSKAKKRSSITYIPSNGTGHSPSQAHFNGRELNEGLMRSPLAGIEASWNLAGGLSRSSSLGAGGRGSSRGVSTPRTAARLSDSHTGAKDATPMSPHVKDRPPVTLVEKHAELLHFIAQKESKCLELRSQLAVHEAELLGLKRKWERIVNRGFGKSLSPGDASSNAPSTSPSSSLLSVSPSPPSSSLTNANFPLSSVLSPTANAPGATVVFEGIKEGVQGMSRLIAAGLESIVQVNVVDSTTDKAPEQSNTIPFRLGSAPQKQQSHNTIGSLNHVYGHGQKESQSSSSTTVSAVSSAGFSSLSLSSVSSTDTLASSSTNGLISNSTSKAHSFSDGSSTSKNTTRQSFDVDADTEDEFGEFENGQASKVSSTRSSLSGRDVLMVFDTGATPTMSPNPDFQRRKDKKAKAVSQIEFLSSQPKVDVDAGNVDSDVFDWDDGWDEPVSEEQARDNAIAKATTASSSLSSSQTALEKQAPAHGNGRSGKRIETNLPYPSSPLTPLSAIPGLTMGMNVAPSTQQMSSWVGSVGKKWGELKGSTTFTRSQKRASVLLSDMQQSIVSVLTSPSTATSDDPTASSFASASSSSAPSQSRTSISPRSQTTFSSNASLQSRKIQTQQQPQSQRSMTVLTGSLLDDSDEEIRGSKNEHANGEDDDTLRMRMGLRMSAPVMVPDSVSPPTLVPSPGGQAKSPNDPDEDDWNW